MRTTPLDEDGRRRNEPLPRRLIDEAYNSGECEILEEPSAPEYVPSLEDQE